MAKPIKSYGGIKKTIDVYEKSFVIKSEGILSKTKKEIPFNEISEITIKTGSFFSPKDTIILKGKGGDEEVRFAPGTDLKKVVKELEELKNKKYSALGKAAATIAAGVVDYYVQSQKEAIINSIGMAEPVTYYNGREVKYPTAPDEIKAVFIASYARAPITVEEPWAKEWRENYKISNPKEYLMSVVREGYLEEAVLGKALSTLKADQLKEMLKDLNLKPSGSKNVLILRLLNEADSNEVKKLIPATIYALTDKGIEYIKEYRETLESVFLDYNKAITSGINKSPDYQALIDEKAKEPKKKRVKKQLTEEEKRKKYEDALKNVYIGLKGQQVKDFLSMFNGAEDEEFLRTFSAETDYSPVPYLDTIHDLMQYKEFYSDELIDKVYKSQTRYMLYDKEGYKNLINAIANDGEAGFVKSINERWQNFVTEYLKKKRRK